MKHFVSADGDNPMAAGASMVDGVYGYEIRIPLSDIGGRIADPAAGKKRRLALGIQIGGLTEAERAMMEDRMGGPRGGPRIGISGGAGGIGVRGGSSGGGMGGPPGGGGMGGPPGGGGPPNGPGQGTKNPIHWLVVRRPPS